MPASRGSVAWAFVQSELLAKCRAGCSRWAKRKAPRLLVGRLASTVPLPCGRRQWPLSSAAGKTWSVVGLVPFPSSRRIFSSSINSSVPNGTEWTASHSLPKTSPLEARASLSSFPSLPGRRFRALQGGARGVGHGCRCPRGVADFEGMDNLFSLALGSVPSVPLVRARSKPSVAAPLVRSVTSVPPGAICGHVRFPSVRLH